VQDTCWICGTDVHPEDNFCRACGVELKRTERGTSRKTNRADSRVSVGIFLLTFGVLVSVISYLIGIVAMLAFGLACFLIGIMTLYIPGSEDPVTRLVTETEFSSLQNTENLLEELDLDQKGIYIPVSGLGVSPKVFVPMALTPATIRPPVGLNQSRRVFVSVGGNPEDRGILLESPGTQILAVIERVAHTDLSKVGINDLRNHLETGLQTLRLARVTQFQPSESSVSVGMELGTLDMDEKLRNSAPRLSAQVGAPIVSATAAAVSKATGKYVTIKSTVLDPRKKKLELNLKIYA